jgi:hypothetical protein
MGLGAGPPIRHRGLTDGRDVYTRNDLRTTDVHLTLVEEFALLMSGQRLLVLHVAERVLTYLARPTACADQAGRGSMAGLHRSERIEMPEERAVAVTPGGSQPRRDQR